MSLSDKKKQMPELKEKMDQQFLSKTTTGDQQKRYKLFKKLVSRSIDNFREININDYDLNITEHFEQLEQVDSSVTPLIYCAYYGLKQICKELLKSKTVDVDLETENNRQTPLLVACICGNYEIVRLLLLAKAEVNKPNLLNHIPLTVTIFRLVEQAASFENKKICFKIADLLIKSGADVNWIIDKKNGFSLLHYFCSLKMKMNKNQKQLNYEIIRFLLEKGANLHQLTLDDKSCLDLLKNHCNQAEVAALLEQFKQKQMDSKIQIKKIKRIGDDYFKIESKKV